MGPSDMQWEPKELKSLDRQTGDVGANEDEKIEIRTSTRTDENPQWNQIHLQSQEPRLNRGCP